MTKEWTKLDPDNPPKCLCWWIGTEAKEPIFGYYMAVENAKHFIRALEKDYQLVAVNDVMYAKIYEPSLNSDDWLNFDASLPPTGLCWWYWDHRILGGKPDFGVLKFLECGEKIIETIGFVYTTADPIRRGLKYIPISCPNHPTQPTI